MSIVIGIDSGKQGAFAILEGKHVDLVAMPLIDNEVDTKAIADMLLTIRSEIKLVVLEDIFALPRSGASSMLSFGRNHGRIEGVLVALQIPYILVRAQTWQKTMFNGITGSDSKTKALKVVSRLFPQADLMATPRSKKPHEGFVDALLIAQYGVTHANM